MNDNKVQFFKKGKYNTHIYNEYLLMKCSKNIKIRSYAKKSLTETVMMRQIVRKEFFRQNEASNLEKIT